MDSLRDPADTACRVIALQLLAALAEREGKLREDRDGEALHDFRVALRRLRSWLRAFEPQLPVLPRKVGRRLRRLARVSNAARDLEVQIGWLRARRSELSVRQRHGQDWLIARLEKRLRKERSRFEARLDRDLARVNGPLESLLQRAPRVLADVVPIPPPDETPFGVVLARVSREQVQRIRDRLEAVQTPGDHRQAHRARIAGKRLRYVLEPVGGIGADEVLGRLKRMQDSLGALEDCQTLSATIASALPAAARARGRRLADLVRDGGLTGGQLRDEEQQDVEPGLIALARRAHTRAQDAFADVERRCLGSNVDALVSAIERIADDLERTDRSVVIPPPTVGRADDVALR